MVIDAEQKAPGSPGLFAVRRRRLFQIATK